MILISVLYQNASTSRILEPFYVISGTYLLVGCVPIQSHHNGAYNSQQSFRFKKARSKNTLKYDMLYRYVTSQFNEIFGAL